ncbi:hypothetical protein [Labrys sp. WJW]|uniref:hypothetical protein n=1 Tax=Labrys sp. WJW TaxID=1737983 RepID=UPI0012E9A4F0|nr:hypothetical protein [Labrys sp. WJW]
MQKAKVHRTARQTELPPNPLFCFRFCIFPADLPATTLVLAPLAVCPMLAQRRCGSLAFWFVPDLSRL